MATKLYDHGLNLDMTSDIASNTLHGLGEDTIDFKPLPKTSILKKSILKKFGNDTDVSSTNLNMKSKKRVYFDVTHIEEHEIHNEDYIYEENGDITNEENSFNQDGIQQEEYDDAFQQNGDIGDVQTLEIEEDKFNEAIKDRNTPLSTFKAMIAEEKEKLKKQLEIFQEKCQRELRAMKQELDDRRELFLLESEELDALAYEQRQQIESELAELQAELNLNKKRQSYQAKEDRLKLLEGDLERRAQNSKDYEQEIIEMEEYLNRRHQMWHDKTIELKERDKELSEYEREISSRKEKLKESGIDLDKNERSDDNELQKKIHELTNSLQNSKQNLYKIESESKEKDLMISSMKSKLDGFTNENRGLQQKMRHLESQLSITMEEVKQMKKKPDNRTNNVAARHGKIFRRSKSLDNETLRGRRKSTISVACTVM
ncbi:hypothetical protein TrispH2_008602 [Trichoplax sp. H2]|nr:hypothetical protein TrispH2_008602 [Trichoplax sp. H2]|eukprot:RDD38999.1 hypothetical protein TrispH2_008602 [Trichoplax sp. H2]